MYHIQESVNYSPIDRFLCRILSCKQAIHKGMGKEEAVCGGKLSLAERY